MNPNIELILSLVASIAYIGLLFAPICIVDIAARTFLGHANKMRYLQITDKFDEFIESPAFVACLYIIMFGGALAFFTCIRLGLLSGVSEWISTLP